MLKTIKVRIAVAVNETGNWDAYGRDCHSDITAINQVLCQMPANKHNGIYFVEADLPVPTAETYQGEVVGA